MKTRRLLLVIGLSIWAMGCVVGQSFKFNYQPPPGVTNVGQGKTVVLLPVADERPYVVQKEEPVNFVGELRNGYGMPFNVTTADSRPFAQIVEESVQRDLEAAGYRVVRGPSASAADRALSVTMKDFMSNTNINIDVVWDFLVKVVDGSGNTVAEEHDSGEQALEGSFMNPVKASKNKVPEFFNMLVHRMVTGNQKIVAALNQ